MIGRIASVVAVICALPVPAAHATSVEKIRNDKVVVTEVTLGPGESEKLLAEHPILLVYMADGKAGDDAVKKGQTVLYAASRVTVRNGGNAPLHFARIEFLTGGKDETWGMTGLRPAYKILNEDRYARTYEIKVPAGTHEPQHTHHARVVVCLSGAEMEHILPDGTKQLATLKTGDILWREGATHTGHNLGTTELWEVAVEPK